MGNEVIVKAKLTDGEYRALSVNESDEMNVSDTTLSGVATSNLISSEDIVSELKRSNELLEMIMVALTC